MTPPTYIPRHGSLAERLLEFFRRNPDEELSRADIALKFDVLVTSVHTGLATALDHGQLQWIKRGNSGVYRLPPEEAKPAPDTAAQAPQQQPSATAQHPPAARPASDLSIEISPDGRVNVSFLIPEQANPRDVLANMLKAAAQSIGAAA